MDRGSFLCGTLILAVCIGHSAIARERRHVSPSNSESTFEKQEAPPANAGQAPDEAVLLRRYEDSRELATLLGVPFDQSFLNKAFDFYTQRGLMTNDPNVSEEDIRSFITDVSGQEASDDLVKMGKRFVAEKKQEFESEVKKVAEGGEPPKEVAEKGKDKDRERDGKRGRRGRRGRDKDGKETDEVSKDDDKAAVAGPIILPANVPTGLASQIAGAPGSSSESGKERDKAVEPDASAPQLFPGQIVTGTTESTPATQVFNNPFVAPKPETAAATTSPRSAVPERITDRSLSRAPATPPSAATPKLNIVVQKGTAFEPTSKIQGVPANPSTGAAPAPAQASGGIAILPPVNNSLLGTQAPLVAATTPTVTPSPPAPEKLAPERPSAIEAGFTGDTFAAPASSGASADSSSGSGGTIAGVSLSPAPIRVATAEAPKSLVDKFRSVLAGLKEKIAFNAKATKAPPNEDIVEKIDQLALPASRIPAASESALLKDFGAEVSFEPEAVRPSWFFLISGVLLLAGGGLGLYRQRHKPSESRALRRLE